MKKILVFDGDCHFCSACVRFVVRFSSDQDLWFAPWGSRAGKDLRKQWGIESEQIFLITQGTCLRKTDAVFELLKDFPWWGQVLRVFRFLPRSVLFFGYDGVAFSRGLISRLFFAHKPCSVDTTFQKRILKERF